MNRLGKSITDTNDEDDKVELDKLSGIKSNNNNMGGLGKVDKICYFS